MFPSRAAGRTHARSTLLAMAVVTASLGSAVALPAYAASDDSTHESPTPQNMARMHQLMMDGNPGMPRMHEQMMTHKTDHCEQK